MSFDEEEDEDENSSSSSQLNSNTRPSSATSKKSTRVSGGASRPSGRVAGGVPRAGRPRWRVSEYGEMMVSRFPGPGTGPTSLTWALRHPTLPPLLFSPARRVGELGLARMTSENLPDPPSPSPGRGRAGELVADPQARLARPTSRDWVLPPSTTSTAGSDSGSQTPTFSCSAGRGGQA